MNILGLSGALGHDASAALLVDGKIIAAAEEERFLRDKHAKNKMAEEATKFCLDFAGLKPSDIDIVAIPHAPFPWTYAGRWHYAKRYWYAPDRALDALFNGNRRHKRYVKQIEAMLHKLGFDLGKTKIQPVEHHLAHASSAYHLSGFKEKTAIIGIDGKGEYATTFFGIGENGKITKLKEFYDPDSLGGVYGALTQYLGFEMLDGEFKVMGMAPYGDKSKYDLSKLIQYDKNGFSVNTKLINTIGLRRYKQEGIGYYFSKKLIDWLGPKRQGDEIDDPYIHYAASMQALLEDVTLELIEHYLGDVIRETGKVCFAGGVALNVKLNQKIIAMPGVKELFVQPAAGDNGSSLGAATYVASTMGETVEPMQHVYLGPKFTNEQCLRACEKYRDKLQFSVLENPVQKAAELLTSGNPLAWFQGRMEFGPRALGNRSILGDPSIAEIADKINLQIKFRERWRPFCPSMAAHIAPEILQTDHPSPYMTFAFEVAEQWKNRIPEVVHEDGTARTQIVTPKTNPRYHELLKAVEAKNGNAVLLNTSLNRRGEPMICSPEDALNMFMGCDLQYLMMEDVLVTK
jgi:carbamoyltransferase